MTGCLVFSLLSMAIVFAVAGLIAAPHLRRPGPPFDRLPRQASNENDFAYHYDEKDHE